MVAWLPALKVILPYVTTVATAAIPAFTLRKDGEKSLDTLNRQIAELQQAAEQNSESVRVLADQMQKALNAIEVAGEENLRRMRRTSLLSGIALIVSLIALIVQYS